MAGPGGAKEVRTALFWLERERSLEPLIQGSVESIQFRISSLNHLPYFGTYICCRPAFIETVKKSEPLCR